MDFSGLRFNGLKSWQRTLYIMFIAQLMSAFGFSSIFPFLPYYVGELGTNTSLSIEMLAGLVYSAQAFTMMISAPIWGTLADRFGRKIMVERAMFGASVLILLMAFAKTAEHVVILRAVQGLVTGTVAAANALVAGQVPRKQTGFAMGLLQVGFGAGIAVGPMIGGLLADAFGYNVTFYFTAGMLFAAGILVAIGVKENVDYSVKINFQQKKIRERWKGIFTTRGVPSTFGMRFLSSLARMMVIPIIPLFIEFLRVDPESINTFTGLIIGAASASTTLSAIYLGRLGDRIGHRKILIVCSFLAGILYIAQATVVAGWQLLVFQILVGTAIGGVIPTVSALLAIYTQPGEEGAVYGLDNSINAAGRAIAPMLGAWVALEFGFRATFPATGIVFLVSVVGAIFMLPKDDLVEQHVKT